MGKWTGSSIALCISEVLETADSEILDIGVDVRLLHKEAASLYKKGVNVNAGVNMVKLTPSQSPSMSSGSMFIGLILLYNHFDDELEIRGLLGLLD